MREKYIKTHLSEKDAPLPTSGQSSSDLITDEEWPEVKSSVSEGELQRGIPIEFIHEIPLVIEYKRTSLILIDDTTFPDEDNSYLFLLDYLH